MHTAPNDTRTECSGNADQALVFQLERVRGEAKLDALVLATEEGLPVAHSGEDELCEELAAMAPFLSEQDGSADKRTTRVCALTVDTLPMWLVSYRHEASAENGAWLEHASRGIERMLSV